jgi:hypothetical protein
MTDRERAARLMVRIFAATAGGLALAIGVLGFFPGHEIHRDGVLTEVRPAASDPGWLLGVMLVTAALGAYVWLRPRLANALLWSMLSVGLLGFALAFTSPPLDLAGGDHEVVRLAAIVDSGALLALMVLQIVVVPAACGLFALLVPDRRPRRRRPARLPVATVYRR